MDDLSYVLAYVFEDEIRGFIMDDWKRRCDTLVCIASISCGCIEVLYLNPADLSKAENCTAYKCLSCSNEGEDIVRLYAGS